MEKSAITTYLEAASSFGHLPAKHLLEKGRFFQAAELPAGVRRGEPKQCYGNAGRLVLRDSLALTYVEGYALIPGLFPMEHAWCVDQFGHVIDNTWDAPERCEYFGLPIPTEYLAAFVKRTGVWGVLDNRTFWADFVEGKVNLPSTTFSASAAD